MRIVAGRWRGRRLVAPRGADTRPTADRVREALFSALVSRLGPGLGGVRVLDAFAGTGALGLEALSRGAVSAVLVEKDRDALDALRANVEALGAGTGARIVAGDAFALAGSGGLPGSPFGLILLDPPYRIEAARVRKLLSDLSGAGVMGDGAFVVWEHASGAETPWPERFEPVAGKRYGTTEVDFATYSQGD